MSTATTAGPSATTKPLNRYSSRITQPASQGASQAMLIATGLSWDDLNKPQVGIGAVWYDGNPCNMHLADLGTHVKRGAEAAGRVGMRFNTVGVSDGISMGTDGMSFSLQSRDLIADSIETIMGAQWYDALVALPGCDKNMPGSIMAMGRLNRPAIMVYGGTIAPGHYKGEDLNIVSAFEALGKKLAGTITEEDFKAVVKGSCPGAGACGGMYTANTMASAVEALGMCLPFNSSYPAVSELKHDEAKLVGEAIRILLEKDLKPRDILTREAFENAIRLVIVLGGSTNAVIHLTALAKAVNVPLSIDDFQYFSDRTPVLADLKPSGKYVMEDLLAIGGVPAVMKSMLKEGLLHGNCLSVTGKTIEENLAVVSSLKKEQDIIRPFDNPLKATGHLQILYGNLAKDGAVAKITGKEGEKFTGPAKVYNSEEEVNDAILGGLIVPGDVVVIRY